MLSSPLRRARQTAAAVADALDVPLVVREALTETDFGGWEGLTFAEAAERDPQLHARWLGDEHVPPPGGESFAVVGARLAAEQAAIVAAYPGETVVVVTPRHPDQAAAAGRAGRAARRSSTGCTWTWRRCRSPTSTRTAGRPCGCSTTPGTYRAPERPREDGRGVAGAVTRQSRGEGLQHLVGVRLGADGVHVR